MDEKHVAERLQAGDRGDDRVTGGLFNAVSMIANLCTVGAIVASLYTETTSKPDLAYAENPARTVVGDPNRSPRIKLLVNDKPAERQVVTAHIAVFNEGSVAIEKTDLDKYPKDHIRIEGDPRVPLIDVTASDDNPGPELKALADAASLAAGSVPLTWGRLEKDEGVRIQVVYYARKPDVIFRLKGRLPNQLTPRRVALARAEQLKELRNHAVVYVLLAILDFVLLAVLLVAASGKRKGHAWVTGVFFFALTFLLVWLLGRALLPVIPVKL